MLEYESVLQGDLPTKEQTLQEGRLLHCLSGIYFLTGSPATVLHVSHGLASEWAESLSACVRPQAGYQIFGHVFMKMIYQPLLVSVVGKWNNINSRWVC